MFQLPRPRRGADLRRRRRPPRASGGGGSGSDSSMARPTPSSPLLPTPLESVLFSVYPATLLLGSLFARLDPTARAAPYDAAARAHPAAQAPSYFARKSNLFNVGFVKLGWFWTTLAFVVFLFTHNMDYGSYNTNANYNGKTGGGGGSSSSSNITTSSASAISESDSYSNDLGIEKPADEPEEREEEDIGGGGDDDTSSFLTVRRIQALLRYALITLWWIVVTQWFFGPGLIDRLFRLTGGACRLPGATAGSGGSGRFSSAAASPAAAAAAAAAVARRAGSAATNIACKAVGGVWLGGHDISGHVFLLALGSTFLGMEVLPVVLRSEGVADERIVATSGSSGGGDAGAAESIDGNNGDDDDDDDDGGGAGGGGGDGAVMTVVEAEQRRQEPQEFSSAAYGPPKGNLKLGFRVIALVASLSWWMFLMTSVYFHTWPEKFTGLLMAFVGIYAVYFLPRAFASYRRVIGMPGI